MDEVADLAVPQGDASHALGSGEQPLDDADGDRHGGRDQRARQRAEGLAVYRHAAGGVGPAEAVDVLPVLDRLFEVVLAGVRQVVRYRAALEALEATGERDRRQQSWVGRAVTHLDGRVDGRDHVTTRLDAVVHGRKAVQRVLLAVTGGGQPLLGRLVGVVAGVGVDRRR